MSPNDSRLGDSDYGYYDAAAREYVVTRPATPAPWLNYLGQGRYGGIISSTAGGFSFDRDPRSRRVSRYRYNALPPDQPGRYIYLRRQDTGEFWGATWQPVRAPLDRFECRHGAGYTRVITERAGARAEVLYFVPPTAPDDPCPAELWVLKLTNISATTLELRTFSYVELSYLDALNDINNLDWAAHIMSSRLDAENFALTAGTKFSPSVQFFAADKEPVGYDTDREVFVGPYRGLESPAVVVAGASRGSEAPRGNNISSLSHDFRLEPGGEAEVVYMLGVTDRPAEIGPLTDRYRDPARVTAAFAALRSDWDEYLDVFSVSTPDPVTTATVNFLAPWQCRTTLYWSRSVSGYETGVGRGTGTRDTAQDTFGVVHARPGEVAARLGHLWELQFPDGHAWHQSFPLSGEGGPGLAAERPEWPQWFCDDHLWLVLATCNYLKETGDYGYLDRRAPYAGDKAGGPQAAAPGSSLGGGGGGGRGIGGTSPDDTVWGHMLAAIDFTLAHRGPHGLPRPGYADWDDTLNIDHGSGQAESVWCAMQFCRAVLDLAELADHLGRASDGYRFREMHRQMAASVNEHAWDGAWYARGFDDEGKPIGVSSAEHNRISLIPQSWSVIGEVAPAGRAVTAMASAHDLLGTPYGPRLLWPPYDGGDPRVNGTSTYPPGAKENGGIFCHAAAWSVVAAARLGHGDRAYEYHRQLLPLARADVERAAVEPYVYCQNICGPSHPQYGLGRNSWLTGAAAWMYVAMTQWILGIRPAHGGLQVAPALPSDWAGFSARRLFRGTWYEIEVSRLGPGREVSLVVDGRPVAGEVVPLPPPGTRQVDVKAGLGRSEGSR